MAFQLPGFSSGSISRMIFVSPGADQTGIPINTAAKYIGAVFMASVSESMVGFVFSCNGVTGTVTNGLQADLYAVDSGGFPTGSSLATATLTPSATVLTAAWTTPYTTTAGTCYAVVIKNILGTPASNYFNILIQGSTAVQTRGWGNNLILWSANSGTTWGGTTGITSTFAGYLNFAPQYTTLGVDAPLIHMGINYNNATTQFYEVTNSRKPRYALKVNFEHDVLLWGVQVPFQGNGNSPTFNLQGEVCSSSASLSTSTSIINCAGIGASVSFGFFWSTPYRFLANTDYYVGVTSAEVGNGSTTVRPNVQVASAARLTPTVGPLKGYYESTQWGGPSWAQDGSRISGIGLHLEIPKPNQMYYAGMRGGFNG